MSIAVVFSGIFFQIFSKQLHAVTKINTVFDSFCAELLHYEVTNYLASKELKKCSTALCHEIKQQFPLIKNITYWQKNNDQCLLYFDVYEPLYSINNDYVMLASGLMVKKDYFQYEAVNSLYNLSVAPEYKRVPSELVHWLAESSDELFDLFNINLINQTEIILTDKCTNFLVYCQYGINFTKKLLTHCLVLKDEAQKLASVQKKLNSYWVADLRFEKQIILYKRGTYEGKCFF